MKALTLHQPWATLVAFEAKRIETRSWDTNYRGPLAIHAGKNREWEYLINETPFYKALSTHPTVWHMQPPIPWGCIVATCELVAIWKITEALMPTDHHKTGELGWWLYDRFWALSPEEYAFGNFAIGRYMWLLDNVKIMDNPIPATGHQRLWEWKEPETKQKILNQDGSTTEVTPLKMWDPRNNHGTPIR